MLFSIFAFLTLALYMSIAEVIEERKAEKLIEENKQKIEYLDKQVKEGESIIDSLMVEISLRESVIDSLSSLRHEVIVEKKVEVLAVRELPLTESVVFLAEKLKEYEDCFEDYYMLCDSASV